MTRSVSFETMSWTGKIGMLVLSDFPVPAVVERDVDAGLGCRVEDARLVDVLADGPADDVVGESAR